MFDDEPLWIVPATIIAGYLAVAAILGGDGWPAWVYRLAI